MWRPRDRERFIGSYDPEHEMPDPDRDPGDRWQSRAYRHHFRDSRFAYRMDPDRFEDRFDARRDVDSEMQMRWNRDARDRDLERGGGMNRDRGGWEDDRGWDRGGMDSGPYGRGGYGSSGGERDWRAGMERDRMERSRMDRDRMDRDRGMSGIGGDSGRAMGARYGSGMDRGRDREGLTGPHYDRDRIYGSDRGWDYGRERSMQGGGRSWRDDDDRDRDEPGRWDRDDWRRW